MSIPEVTTDPPLVSATVPSGDGYLEVTATLLGRPMMEKGKPVRVELLLGSGRFTTVPFTKVVPLTDAARELLRWMPGGRA